jgi:23S rRNA (guanine745-N1)-methyltransferase
MHGVRHGFYSTVKLPIPRSMLVCPVRDCRLPLIRDRLLCERGHSFDVARSGYINLLQPQDRRSNQPGDTTAAVAARRRLHDRGVTGPLLRAVAEILAASESDVVLDAGCGDGFYLGTLARQTGFSGHGVDISVPAIEAAARRYPECQWMVANADRFVPPTNSSGFLTPHPNLARNPPLPLILDSQGAPK